MGPSTLHKLRFQTPESVPSSTKLRQFQWSPQWLEKGPKEASVSTIHRNKGFLKSALRAPGGARWTELPKEPRDVEHWWQQTDRLRQVLFNTGSWGPIDEVLCFTSQIVCGDLEVGPQSALASAEHSRSARFCTQPAPAAPTESTGSRTIEQQPANLGQSLFDIPIAPGFHNSTGTSWDNSSRTSSSKAPGPVEGCKHRAGVVQ